MKKFVWFLFTLAFTIPLYAEDDPPPPSLTDWVNIMREDEPETPPTQEFPEKELPKKEPLPPMEKIIIQEPKEKKSLFDGSLALRTGMLFGGMDEYVYEKGHKEELSRLEWEEYFVPIIDLRGEFSVWDFFIEGAILSAVPIKSGKMRDYDYFIADKPTEASKFSEHDAYLDKHFETSAALGYKFNFKRWYIAPAAGIFYRERKWSAMDGYTQYPSDDNAPVTPDIPKKDYAGTIITYQESTYMLLVSLKGGFRINDMFEVGAHAAYYPYINVSTIDNHISTQARYHDKMQGFRLFALEGEAYLVFRPKRSSFIGWTLGAGWQGVFPGRGTTEIGRLDGKSTELTMLNAYQSRSESSVFWFNIGILMRFGKK